MLTLSQIMDGLRDRKITLVAEACDLPYSEVWRISCGRAMRVKPKTLQRLSDYLEGKSDAATAK
jgi:hypothetical protein